MITIKKFFLSNNLVKKLFLGKRREFRVFIDIIHVSID